jgi:hypothetical protein
MADWNGATDPGKTAVKFMLASDLRPRSRQALQPCAKGYQRGAESAYMELSSVSLTCAVVVLVHRATRAESGDLSGQHAELLWRH